MIFAVYTVASIRFGQWSDTLFVGELFFVAILIFIVQMVTNFIKSNYYLLELLVEYLTVIIVVGVFGLLFDWFHFSYLWMVFVYVTPVYLVGYLLDMVRTRQDVAFINEKIKQRAERGLKNGKSDDNSQGGL
jgi:hypothetical protein